MSSSSSLLLLFASICLLSIPSTSSDTRSIRRLLQIPTEKPTKVPTPAPTPICRYSSPGDTSPVANPSTIKMGIVIGNTGLHDIDLENGDTNLDGDNARIGLCQAAFGSTSKPVYPNNENTFDAMMNLCESLGGGNECYVGLYRQDYNNNAEDCDTWRGEDNTLTLTSSAVDDYANGWANRQPSCPWLASTDEKYDASNLKHCVTYKTNTNKLLVRPCTLTYHVICTYHDVCNL